MNLSDLRQEGTKLEEDLQVVKDVMIRLQSLVDAKENFKSKVVEIIVTNSLYASSIKIPKLIEQLTSLKESYCKNFIIELRKINFTSSIVALTQIKNEYKNFDFKSFYSGYFDMINVIHDYTSLTTRTDEFEVMENVFSTIKLVVDLYNTLLHDVKEIDKVYIKLFGDSEENYLTIRLMNENNYVSNLNNNIALIENIYNSVNELIGNPDEKLTYIRAESGTFAMWLAGFGATLLTMRPLLELAYKVYSEQISPKAKIELELKKVELDSSKIKLRADYLRLMKDATESKELNITDSTKIVTIIGDLDMDIKKLYSNNPYIKLDEKDLGLKDLPIDKVPIELKESDDKDIKELEELTKKD